MARYYGTSGNDYYNYMGTERLNAETQEGNDTILGNTNNDYIFGDSGNDKLYGWTGNDNLSGGAGNDWISGEDGKDNLSGGTNNDTLFGGKGDDTIEGSLIYSVYNSNEYDVLNGGNGYDTFVLGNFLRNNYLGTGHAIIQDFNLDYIQLKGSASSFRLNKSKNLVGGAGIDTAIYSGTDLLAIVQDTTDLYLTKYFFKFV
ncbi:hypothetical protein QUA41_28655 [Microcoleus sp. Pol11C1]|uniref:hypothetical protein n=1 Tax=unclassified Microcoleus TaxID=2642155 RepID=UPI002FD27156